MTTESTVAVAEKAERVSLVSETGGGRSGERGGRAGGGAGAGEVAAETREGHGAGRAECEVGAVAAPAAPKAVWSAKKWALIAGLVAGLGLGGYALRPMVETALNTVSTDDAYVNGHVTMVAPRVGGQVARVLVDDNDRVKKGDLLMALDKAPYEVQVAIKRAAVATAEADLAAAHAQVRAQMAQARANRYMLQHAIDDVQTETANLAAAVATLNRAKAALTLAQSNLQRGENVAAYAIGKEELDERRQTVKIDQATVDETLQKVYAIRVGLGLPAEPGEGKGLADVPANLADGVSAVQQDLGLLLQSAAQFGYFPRNPVETPAEAVAEFLSQDPSGDLEKILNKLAANAPAVKQAEARVAEAKRELEQAELNLSYCDVVSEIDGVVTSRNINPGNNVQAGQSVMAVRSVKEVWVDANFKETQLGDLRIGQRVRCEVDMYGKRKEFAGRISGFTMGTGQTLSLLPAENATGNYVKIVQRLPVKVELTDYDPEKAPLFAGLSVTPYVYYKEKPTGEGAGRILREAR